MWQGPVRQTGSIQNDDSASALVSVPDGPATPLERVLAQRGSESGGAAELSRCEREESETGTVR